MAIVRVSKTSSDQYTTLLNTTLQDTRLSLAAKGLLVRLLSKPKNWNINVNFLAAEHRLNRKTIYKLINELIAFGYCTRRKFNNGRVEYTLYEEPVSEKRDEARSKKRIKENKQVLNSKIPQSEKASFHFLGRIEKRERTIESKDSLSAPTRARTRQEGLKRECERVSHLRQEGPRREPKTPHNWAQYFIERCGYRIEQVVYIPKAMAMFRQWIADGVTLEDVEDAAAAAEAKLNGYPANPTYYRRFVAEVLFEKQRAKENPAATGNSKPGLQKNNNKSQRYYETNRPSGQRLSSAERVRREGIEYLRRTNQLTDREWSAYLQDIGEFKPDPLNRAAHEYAVDTDGGAFPPQMVIESGDYWQQCI
jgi:hypothetical protein